MKALTVALLLIATTATAAPWRLPENEEMVEQATLIAAGKIVASKVQKIEHPDGALSTRTLSTFQAAQCFKGPCSSGVELVIVTPGGSVGDFVMDVYGMPTLDPGREYLVLLEPRDDGTWKVLHQAIGEAEVDLSVPRHQPLDPDPDTLAMGFFGIPAPTPTSAPSTRAEKLRERFGLAPPPPTTRKSRRPLQPLLGAPRGPCCKVMSNPPAVWRGAVPVVQSSDGDSTIGEAASQAAIVGAVRAWADASRLGLEVAPKNVQPGGYRCIPGKLLVIFNDPAEQITNPVNCSAALAVGGFCASGVTDGDGRTTITAGAVLFGDGWEDCTWFWNAENVAHIMTHEVGHAIGFAHSCEYGEPCDPVSTDATMMWVAKGGRGAKLAQYDEDTVSWAYGEAGGPTPVPTAAPTPSPTPQRSECPPGGFVNRGGECSCTFGEVWDREGCLEPTRWAEGCRCAPKPTATPQPTASPASSPGGVSGTVDIRTPKSGSPGVIVDLWPYDGRGVQIIGNGKVTGVMRGSAMPLTGKPSRWTKVAGPEIQVKINRRVISLSCEGLGVKHTVRWYCRTPDLIEE